MASLLSSTGCLPPRVHRVGEGIALAALAATVAGTTLSLGGFLAETMVFTVAALSGTALLAALVWGLGAEGEPRSFHWAVLVPLPFLVFALVSSVGRAPAGWLAWREWLLWWQAWLVFAVTLHVGRGRAQTWILVGTLAALGLAGVGLAAYQRTADPAWLPLGRTQALQFRGRSSGMFGIPNSLAAFLELLVPACLGLFFSTSVRSTTKVVAGWLAALLLAGVALTGSRGGWLALTLALLAWTAVAGGDWTGRLRRVGVVLTLVGLSIWGLYRGSDYARDRLDPILQGRVELTRPVMWRAAVALWQESPVLGQGAAAYNVLFDRHRPERFGDEPLWAHNDYLNTLCDHGLLGFVLWAGGGIVIMVLGWRAARFARRRQSATDLPFGLGKWKLGLWIGLLAFALHLAVDFHTKIPALAFVAAAAAALMLRDDERLRSPVRLALAGPAVSIVLLATMVLLVREALPLYRAEALRFEARGLIDRYARDRKGDLNTLLRRAKPMLVDAVGIDPSNGQAWADLAYLTSLSGSLGQYDAVALGRFAELAADRAIELCPQSAEYWVRRGVALDLQRGRPDAEANFTHALTLAPNSAVWWFYYVRHLQRFPERNSEAIDAIGTCLTLDPYYPGAESLRQQLVTRR